MIKLSIIYAGVHKLQGMNAQRMGSWNAFSSM